MINKTRLTVMWLAAATLAACSSNGDEPDKPATNPSVPEAGKWRMVKLTDVEYDPAPGQFVNEIPEYEAGDTRTDMNAKALEMLNDGDLISLGALGGSVTMTLAEPIKHNPAYTADFRIVGNCYLTGTEGSTIFGAAEPGIVYVMEDKNGNGIPDDTWYELRGQMYDQRSIVTVSYTEPAAPSANAWVEWRIDDKHKGALTCNREYHNHTYFPRWLGTKTMTIKAVRLPDNGEYDAATGRYRQVCWTGYADAMPNNSEGSMLSLANAVDEAGQQVTVRQADFVRVVSAILQSNGPLGECSTEVGGIQALHD